MLDRDVFPSVFHDYSVMYFDPTWEYLVPDVRWFPTANAASRVADALVNEPPQRVARRLRGHARSPRA